MSRASPVVGIIMGSRSDWPTLKAAASILDTLKVPYETAWSPPTAPLSGSTAMPTARGSAG